MEKKSINSILKQFTTNYQGIECKNLTPIEIVEFDLILYVFNKIIKKGILKNSIIGLSELLNGYYTNKDFDRYLSKIRYICSKFSSDSYTLYVTEEYKQLDKHIRMFNIKDDSSIELNTTYRFKDNAIYNFEILLSENISFNKNKKIFFNMQDEFEEKAYFIYDNQKLSVNLDNMGINNFEKFCPRYKKERIEISLTEIINTAKEMDKIYPNNNYENRVKNIIFHNLELSNKEYIKDDKLTLNGLKHIVGMVGSGKSTLMKVISKICDKKGYKIALIVNNIKEVDNIIQELNLYNVNATALISLNNRKEHINKIIPKENSVLDRLKNISNRPYLNNICLLNGAKEDKSISIEIGEEPCFNLGNKVEDIKSQFNNQYRLDKNLICPYINECPKFSMYKNIDDYSVYVCTPANLVNSNMPKHLYSEQISVLNYIYSKCDLVIVDEADEVQSTLDSIFAPINQLLDGSDLGWLNKLCQNIIYKYPKDSFSSLLKDRINKSIRYAEAITRISEKKSLNTWIEGFIDEQSLIELFYKEYKISLKDIDILCENNDKNIKYIEEIYDYYYYKQDNILNDHIKKFNINISDNDMVDKFIFILVIKLFDLNISFVLKNIQICIHSFELEEEKMFYNITNEFQNILTNFPAGNFIKYKIDRKNNKSWIKLSYINTEKMGRDLLYKLPYLYRYTYGIEGPCTVLLSGTSYAGKSPVFNINRFPDTIIEGELKEFNAINESEAYFTPQKDSEGMAYNISGLRGEKRLENIKNICNKLSKPDPNEEYGENSFLNMILKKLKYEFKNRTKILIVVGSYEEAKYTSEILRSNAETIGIDKNKIINVVKDGEIFNKEISINRGEINTIGNKDVNIIVAPIPAIGRAHNIMNDDNIAAIGAVIFMVRYMINPMDESYYISYINDLYQRDKENFKDISLEDIRNRKYIYRRKLNEKIKESVSDKGYLYLLPEDKDRICWTILSILVQTIGRCVRGGAKTYCYFIDGKFAPNLSVGDKENEDESILYRCVNLLEPYFKNKQDAEGYVIEKLYKPFYLMLKNIID